MGQKKSGDQTEKDSLGCVCRKREYGLNFKCSKWSFEAPVLSLMMTSLFWIAKIWWEPLPTDGSISTVSSVPLVGGGCGDVSLSQEMKNHMSPSLKKSFADLDEHRREKHVALARALSLQ